MASPYSDVRFAVKISAGAHYVNCQALLSACPIEAMISTRVLSLLKEKENGIEIRKTQQKSDKTLYHVSGTEDEAKLRIRYFHYFYIQCFWLKTLNYKKI
jgi:hypothetical protein